MFRTSSFFLTLMHVNDVYCTLFPIVLDDVAAAVAVETSCVASFVSRLRDPLVRQEAGP